MSDTTITKVDGSHSPHGQMGQKYLASGKNVAMRLWENEQPGNDKPAVARDYETVGYVLSGRAELHSEGQTVTLNAGDSWVVPHGASHTYKILEPFTAVEATCPPAQVHSRDEDQPVTFRKTHPMNKKLLTLTAGAALLTFAPAASAQMSAPLDNVDTAYLIDSAQGSVSDLAHGEAGVQGASTNELRQYAIQIVEDHSRLNMQLYQLAQRKGVALPVTMKDEDRKELEGLVKKSGKDFDAAFLQAEVRINTQDVADGQKELTTTNDPEVKAVVREYLDTESVMLSRAQAFLSAMGTK